MKGAARSPLRELFYNRFGQFIYREPAGRYAGYDVPQFSIHRGDLQMVLLEAFSQRAGADRVVTGWRCTNADPHTGLVQFEDSVSAKRSPHNARTWS
jgi:hypothetical protein